MCITHLPMLFNLQIFWGIMLCNGPVALNFLLQSFSHVLILSRCLHFTPANGCPHQNTHCTKIFPASHCGMSLPIIQSSISWQMLPSNQASNGSHLSTIHHATVCTSPCILSPSTVLHDYGGIPE